MRRLQMGPSTVVIHVVILPTYVSTNTPLYLTCFGHDSRLGMFMVHSTSHLTLVNSIFTFIQKMSNISEVKALNKQLLKAVSTGDWKTYQSLCAEDLSCFEPETAGQVVEGLGESKEEC